MRQIITRKFEFTKEEVEKILTEHVANKINEPDKTNTVKNVSWDITKGDVGIKDPMDSSSYQPAEVKSVTVKL